MSSFRGVHYTLALTYSYIDANNHNNGNVQSVTNNLASWRSQSFSYDSLNRLTSAQSVGTHATNPTDCWAESYTYDAWGNLLSDQPDPFTQSAYAGCTAEAAFSTTANANNQIALLNYDAAGNVTTCQSYMGGAATCTYDAENHITQFSWAGGSTTYTYDGDGKRVMKSGSPGTIYWYGAGSDALIETDLSNNAQAGYAYFNGQRALRILPNNEVGFYFTDHLGNTRYFQSLAGDNVSDFYPFGGERVYFGGAPSHYKFTGKERDSDSGNDNFAARYNSSSLGRFMSPDPENSSGYDNPGDPQGWNAYSYVRNNPLNLTDTDGRDFYVCVDDGYGGKNCVIYHNDAELMKALGASGVTLQNGNLYATVNGQQVQIGTALHFAEGSLDVTADYFFNIPALFSGVKAIFNLGRAAAAFELTTIGSGARLARAAAAREALRGSGGFIDRVVQTSAGPVRVLARVEAEGETAVIKELAVYPATGKDEILDVGYTGMRQGFKQVLSDLKEAGYNDFRIEPQYRSGGPGASGGANPFGYTGTLKGKL